MTAVESLAKPHLRRFFRNFTEAGFAVLVSDDAGADTWGAPKVLDYLAQVREEAIREFPFNGITYALGYSMGGLPALMSAYRASFPVSGVLLLDARVNLLDAWQSNDVVRRREIAQAFGVLDSDPLPLGSCPLSDFQGDVTRRVPVFVAGSPDDRTVPFAVNGQEVYRRVRGVPKQLMVLSGPHLGASHFADEVAESMVAFLERLEHLARAAKRAQETARVGGSPPRLRP